MRLWTLYVPNGRKAGSPHDDDKLAFLDVVRAMSTWKPRRCPAGRSGCWATATFAPTDADVWDPAVLAGGTHVSVDERAALESLRTGVGRDGLVDLKPRASQATSDTRHPFTF